ncbi:VWA domain-containing protein [Paenibacillus sp. P96]|uniref:VWA domain-containing protein n=1 Tax=Paenibacillus zeirhizosphaerae TaxID=2987519 RepID=A0ABT9FRD2_9BACL|nr:vWA domain-containing protein [Paenibacillus sp. P96]MDP4097293.1 VWA domain-containing protein [Paenibacillus sp. P96]
MMQRKLNIILLLFSLIGGAVGFVIGEILLLRFLDEWPHWLVIGAYFGIMALCIGVFCLIAELINPQLNGISWKQRYSGLSWRLLVPATLAMLFAAGSVLELGYQINPAGAKKVNDLVLVIDNSGSMTENDPNNDRITAAKHMISQMDGNKRVSVILFGDESQVLQPFTPVATDVDKQAVYDKLDQIPNTDAGTNIGLALSETLDQIQDQGNDDNGAMVILLSDGYSDLDTASALAPYIERQIEVNTVGLSITDSGGVGLLQAIAQMTGGIYYDVTDAGQLSLVFGEIYNSLGDRTLVTERTGMYAESTYLAVYRTVALAIIGALIGLALGLMFDNRYLARNFAIGGVPAGLLAGLLLENGLRGSIWLDPVVRFLAALLLAGIIALFSFVLPIRDHRKSSAAKDTGVSTRPGRRGEGFEDAHRNSRSKGF